MKLRKFLTIIACFVFVLVGAFGFAGCAHTSNVDAQEALTYVQEVNFAETIGNGYKFKASIMGEDAEAIILLGEHPQAYMKSSEGTIYYKDDYVYLSDGTRKVKIEFPLEAALEDVPLAYRDYVESVKEALSGENDMFDLEEWMGYIEEMLDNETLKTTKTIDGKKVTYSFKGAIENAYLSMSYKIGFTFTDGQFTSISAKYGTKLNKKYTEVMSIQIAPYAGTIKFPSFAGYEQVDIAH